MGKEENLSSVGGAWGDCKEGETEQFAHWTLLSRVHMTMPSSHQHSNTVMINYDKYTFQMLDSWS